MWANFYKQAKDSTKIDQQALGLSKAAMLTRALPIQPCCKAHRDASAWTVDQKLNYGKEECSIQSQRTSQAALNWHLCLGVTTALTPMPQQTTTHTQSRCNQYPESFQFTLYIPIPAPVYSGLLPSAGGPHTQHATYHLRLCLEHHHQGSGGCPQRCADGGQVRLPHLPAAGNLIDLPGQFIA